MAPIHTSRNIFLEALWWVIHFQISMTKSLDTLPHAIKVSLSILMPIFMRPRRQTCEHVNTLRIPFRWRTTKLKALIKMDTQRSLCGEQMRQKWPPKSAAVEPRCLSVSVSCHSSSSGWKPIGGRANSKKHDSLCWKDSGVNLAPVPISLKVLVQVAKVCGH